MTLRVPMVFNATRSLAAELPSGDLLDLGTVDNSPLADYIGGMKMVWNSATSISATSGAMYIQSLGKIVAFPSTLTLSGLSLSASTLYHLYGYVNSGTPTLLLSTTAPAAAYSGTARSMTGDTAKRYIGSLCTDASNNVNSFIHQGNLMVYQCNIGTSQFLVVSASTATTLTSASCSGVVPITARVANLLALNTGNSGANVALGNSDQGFTTSGSAYSQFLSAGAYIAYPQALNSSQAFNFLFTTGPSSGAFNVRLQGYLFER